jgi:hypothetical protein
MSKRSVLIRLSTRSAVGAGRKVIARLSAILQCVSTASRRVIVETPV